MSALRENKTETGQITGTMDKDYNLFRYIENCLENALRLETYRRDAELGDDTALAALFTMAQSDNRKGAEIGKKLLASRLSAMISADTDTDTGTDTRTGPHVNADADAGAGNAASSDQADNPPADVMAPSRDRER